MTRKRYCPTCTALHQERAALYELHQVRDVQTGSEYLRCGWCGRTWVQRREGLERANPHQREMGL